MIYCFYIKKVFRMNKKGYDIAAIALYLMRSYIFIL
jgi:hypothetical protein